MTSTRSKHPKSVSILNKTVNMEEGLFSLRWAKRKGGYRISDIERRSAAAIFTGEKNCKLKIKIIRGKGKKWEWYSPLEVKDLHKKFVSMGDSPEDILNFVKEFGFLGVPSHFSTHDDYFEEVNTIIKVRNELKEATSCTDGCSSFTNALKRIKREFNEETGIVNNDDAQGEHEQIVAGAFNRSAPDYMKKMSVVLAPNDIGKKKNLTLKIVPDTLLSGMWLLSAHELMSGKQKDIRQHRLCKICNKPILNIYRKHKATCSDNCRKKYSELRKTK